MPYLYTTYFAVTNKSERFANLTETPTITTIDGLAGGVIASPAPTWAYLGKIGAYKATITLDDLTDVLFFVEPAAADQAEIADIAALHSKVEQIVEERIDSPISETLQAADYTAPANAEILAIDARLPAQPAAVGDLVNLDVPISNIPTGVWAEAGYSASDIAAIASQLSALSDDMEPVPSLLDEIKTLLSGGFPSLSAIKEAVWTNPKRTLTIPLLKMLEEMLGNSLVLYNFVTYSNEWEVELPQDWEKLVFTAKNNPLDPDEKSIIQVVLSNEPAETDGMLYFDQQAAGDKKDLASLSLTDDGVSIEIGDKLDFSGYVGGEKSKTGHRGYDLKCLLPEGKSALIIPPSKFVVKLTETHKT